MSQKRKSKKNKDKRPSLGKKEWIFIGFAMVFVLILVNQLSDKTENPQKQSFNLLADGQLLARKHCSTCHAFPKASILPQSYWKNVLPIMGFFLGAGKDEYIFVDYLNPASRTRLSASGIFPKKPLISKEEWKAINAYYYLQSPPKLAVKETPPVDMTLDQFAVKRLPWESSSEGLSYLNFHQGQYELGFYTETESYWIRLDQNSHETLKIKIASPLVDLYHKQGEALLLLMGEFQNLDIPTGKIVKHTDSQEEIADELERPICFEVEDFNNDGAEDILIAEFGKFLGGINLYPEGDQARKINLHPSPGAVKTLVKDVNHDGLKDFYVLVAQAEESIYLFVNRGNFTFEKKRVLQLPAHYGTTHFEMLDVDGDGDDDLITSSGDSGDYGIVLKPFHGVRIFENLGKNQFKQVWFFPQQGAYGTTSADFDQDGDVDIASIGYFASYFEREQELFLYFENQGSDKGKWQFAPHSFPAKANDSWMLISSADVDQDGDLDILLGANSKILDPQRQQSKVLEWQEQGGMVTVLTNNLVK